MEVLFGVGFGGGEARKRFVEQANYPLLFWERGKDYLDAVESRLVYNRNSGSRCQGFQLVFEPAGQHLIEQEFGQRLVSIGENRVDLLVESHRHGIQANLSEVAYARHEDGIRWSYSSDFRPRLRQTIFR